MRGEFWVVWAACACVGWLLRVRACSRQAVQQCRHGDAACHGALGLGPWAQGSASLLLKRPNRGLRVRTGAMHAVICKCRQGAKPLAVG